MQFLEDRLHRISDRRTIPRRLSLSQGEPESMFLFDSCCGPGAIAHPGWETPIALPVIGDRTPALPGQTEDYPKVIMKRPQVARPLPESQAHRYKHLTRHQGQWANCAS